MKTLYDWQEADVTAAMQHDSWFLAYEMGLGKTLVTVEWLRRKGARQVIVVCPLNTRDSWEDTIKGQIPDANVRWLENTTKLVGNFADLKAGKPGWYLIGWELMRTGVLTGFEVDAIVADETHKQANYGRSDQAVMLREFKAPTKAALSGTPAANKPEGIFSTLNWLWPKRYKSLWNWTETFWRTIRNGAVIEYVRELKPGGVIADIPMFTRRLRKDHRKDMPAVLPEIPISVGLTATQRKLYDRLAKEAGIWLDDGENFVSTSVKLVENMRLRQILLGVPTVTDDGFTFKENAGSTKVDALIEVIQTDEFKDQTFLVLTHSARFVPVVVAKLAKKGILAKGFTGDTPQSERRGLIDDLGETYQVLVAGIAAIGTGTDGLQYKTHNMFWLSKHPEWLLNKQASMRCDRPGQSEPINQWYTYVPETVDEDSLERLQEIEENLVEMIDAHPVSV